MLDHTSRAAAIEQFAQARRQAQIDTISARITGRDNRLLPFETIRTELRHRSPLYRGVHEVPINEIVGSVGRYSDLNRRFLPLNNSMQERFVRLISLALTEGWPPIDLFKVGGVYFVKDGNHRVTVARQMEFEVIEAHVWEYPEDVQIGPEDTLDDILIRFGERNFMEETGLTERYPDHGIRFTTPGRYTELRAQIANLREKLTQIDGVEPSYEEAVDAWYEMVYLPTLQIIHDSSLLEEFPGRTEADLFVWMSGMREPLQEAYGEINHLSDLATLLAEHYKEGGFSRLSRQIRGLFGEQPLPPLNETLPGEEE